MSKYSLGVSPSRTPPTVSPPPRVEHGQRIVVRQKDDGCCLWNLVKAFFSMIGKALCCLFCCNSGQKSSLPNRTQQTSPLQGTTPQKVDAATSRGALQTPPTVSQNPDAPPQRPQSAPSSPLQPIDATFEHPLMPQPTRPEAQASPPPQQHPLRSPMQGSAPAEVRASAFNTPHDAGVSAPVSPDPIEFIVSDFNQNDLVPNSCTFQALEFLQKMFEAPDQQITTELLNSLLWDAASKYTEHDQNNFNLYDPMEIPTHYHPSIHIAAEEGGFANAGAIEQGLEQVGFDGLLRNLPKNADGISGAVMTFRNESYAVFLRSNGEILLFNSHSTQQRQANVKANVQIFASIDNLVAFLATNYPAIDIEETQRNNADQLQILLALDENLPHYVDYQAFRQASLHDQANALMDQYSIPDTFSATQIKLINTYRSLLEIQQASEVMTPHQRACLANANVVNMTPFLGPPPIAAF